MYVNYQKEFVRINPDIIYNIKQIHNTLLDLAHAATYYSQINPNFKIINYYAANWLLREFLLADSSYQFIRLINTLTNIINRLDKLLNEISVKDYPFTYSLANPLCEIQQQLKIILETQLPVN